MSRSCQSATFSSPTTAAARTTRARPRDPLGDLRVPLVRHRRRALHPGRERLLDLAHLGARQVADLGREAVERRRARARASRAARRAGRARSPASRAGPARARAARTRSARPPGRRPRTCRPCPRAGRRGSPRARAASRVAVAVELERPAGELPAERRRLGVDPVRAADADRVPVLLAPAARPRRARGRAPARTSAPASWICSESAVSTTSDEVRP